MMGFLQGVVIASGMVLGCENFISLTYVDEGMQVDWNRRKRVQISKQQDWCRACERAVIVATSGFLCCVWHVCCRRLSLAFFRGFVVPSRGKEDLRCCFFHFAGQPSWSMLQRPFRWFGCLRIELTMRRISTNRESADIFRRHFATHHYMEAGTCYPDICQLQQGYIWPGEEGRHIAKHS